MAVFSIIRRSEDADEYHILIACAGEVMNRHRRYVNQITRFDQVGISRDGHIGLTLDYVVDLIPVHVIVRAEALPRLYLSHIDGSILAQSCVCSEKADRRIYWILFFGTGRGLQM